MADHRGHLSFFDKYSIEQKVSGSDETLLRDKKTGCFVLMKEVLVDSNQQFRVVIDTLESQRCLRHDHLLSLIDYEIRPQESEGGGVTRKIITFFEYSKHTLEDEINSRVREGRPFEENELWSLLFSATMGLAYLQKESVGHGCVSPIDIFLDKEGTIMIADPSIATSSPLDCQEGYYYAPEMLEHQPEVDVFKADVWSLAMCVLQAALLEPCDDCYDYEQNVLHYELLQQRIDKLGESYSKQFIETLMTMLAFEAQQRPNFLELEEHLSKMLDLSGSLQSESSMRESELQTSTTQKSIRRSTLANNPLPAGQKPMEEEQEQLTSLPEIECLCFDLESTVDKNEEEQSTEQKLQSLDINITTNTGEKGQPQTHVIHVQTNRPFECEEVEVEPSVASQSRQRQMQPQPTGLMSILSTQRGKECASMYDSRNNREPIHPKPLLGQNRIPISITTSKYEQQENNRDFYNVSNKASIIVDLQSQKKPAGGFSTLGTHTIPTVSSTYQLHYQNKPLYEPTGTKQAYPEWGGYVYRPSEDQLFTDPKLLQMMKQDLQRIQNRQLHL